jgi:hypothetical protein
MTRRPVNVYRVEPRVERMRGAFGEYQDTSATGGSVKIERGSATFGHEGQVPKRTQRCGDR